MTSVEVSRIFENAGSLKVEIKEFRLQEKCLILELPNLRYLFMLIY